MASEQNKQKSQHFLSCSDFHFVDTRKVLSSWKSLSFPDLGIHTEVGGGQSHGGSDSLCWTWTAERSWDTATPRLRGILICTPWLSSVWGRLGSARARCEHTRSDWKPHLVPSTCVLSRGPTGRLANVLVIPAFITVFHQIHSIHAAHCLSTITKVDFLKKRRKSKQQIHVQEMLTHCSHQRW